MRRAADRDLQARTPKGVCGSAVRAAG
jgi:hypothetical protein